MKKRLTINRLISVVVMIFISAGLFAQTNILANSGFELGQSPGTFSQSATYGAWTANNTSWTALLGMPYAGMPTLEGTNAMHIGNSRQPGSVSQTFATAIGANYEVSLWVRGWPGEVGNGTIRIFNGGNTDLNTSFSSAGVNVWTQRQFTFIASGTSTTIELKNISPAATNIDDVSITMDACNSTTTLMDSTTNDGSFESNAVYNVNFSPTTLPPVWNINSSLPATPTRGGLLSNPPHNAVLAGADGSDALFADNDGATQNITTATSYNLLGGSYPTVSEGDVFTWSFMVNSWSANSTGTLKLNFGAGDIIIGAGTAGDFDLSTYATISGTYIATAADAAGSLLSVRFSIATGTGGTYGNVYGDNVRLSVESGDTEPPTIACNSAISVNNDAGICGATVTYSNSSEDNCPGQTIVQTDGLASGALFPIGTTTNTFVVTDASGNTATCSFDVTVTDNEAPAFGDITEIQLYSNDFETPHITPTSDWCTSDLSVFQGVNTLYGPGWHQIFTVETILINGPQNYYTDPTARGGNYSLGMYSSGQEDRVALTFDAQDKDFLNVSFDLSAIAIGPCDSRALSTPVMRVLVYDSPGGSFNINAPGTLLDQADLTGIPPANGANSLEFNWAQVISALDVTGSLDGNVSLMFDLLVGGYGSIDNLIISASNVSIENGCPEDIVVNNDPGSCGAAITLTPPTVIDNCTNTGNALNFDGVDDYVVTQPMTIANTGITVEAWINPTAFSLYDRIAEQDYASAWFFGSANGSNDLSVWFNNTEVAVTSGSQITLGSWQHVAFVYDLNTIKIYINGVEKTSAVYSGSVSSNLPLYIGEIPNFTFPDRDFDGSMDEVRIWNIARTQAEIQANMNIELNIKTGLVASYHFNEGIADGNNAGVTTATDASGNGNDGTLNSFALTGSTSNWVAGNAFSALTVTNDAPATYPIGNTTVTWTVTDASGNADTCTQIVTVVAPEINVSGNSLTISDGDTTPDVADDTDFGQPLPAVPVVHTFTIENNGTAPLTVNSLSMSGAEATNFTIGGITTPLTIAVTEATTFTVTFAATPIGNYNATVNINNDDCDEAQYDFAVHAEVSCLPAAFTACPTDIEESNTASLCEAVVSYTATVIGDPAPNVTYTFTGATSGSGSGTGSGSSFNVGVTNVTINATNACDDVDCTFTVTITDDEAPLIVDCPANILQGNDIGDCEAVVSWTEPMATDNCTDAIDLVWTKSHVPGDTFPVGTTTVTYSANDAASNTSLTCSFDITITDDEAPLIVDCPSNILQGNDAGVCEAVVTWIEPTATDNCDSNVNVVRTDNTGLNSGDLFPVGTTTITYTATDAATNTSLECSFDVTVTNTLPNSIVGISAGTDPVQAGVGFNLSADFADDNLTSATWYFSSDGNFTGGDIAEYTYPGTIAGGVVSGVFNFDATQTGVYTVKVEVEDACGETAVALHSYVVIYDASGGFVTGGGWIYSEPGALVGTTEEGKANFGFVAKYAHGNNNVTLNGNTNFQFKEGDFHFKSSDYAEMSLVISGQRKATYRGSGTVNGSGFFDFMVTVIDGDAPGAGPADYDSFRIKIWTAGSPNDVIYDNELGSGENADASTALGRGSIVIHKPQNGNGHSAIFSDHTNANSSLFDATIWPSPSDNYFNIDLISANLEDRVEVQIFDLIGKLVQVDNFDATLTYKFGERLQVGVYFVKLFQANKIITLKVVKK